MAESEAPAPAPVARVLALVTIAIGIAVAVTTLIGLFRIWHPLPYMDTWDAYGTFWYRVQGGDAAAWWDQHNEHRIPLARMLMWADLRFFNGSTVPPVIANVALLAAATLLVVLLTARHLREVRRTLDPVLGFGAIAAGAVVACWSWYEITNLEWGFQVSFFLCVALALGAFAAVSRSASSMDHRRGFLVLAFSCVALSPWTIPVGLLVPFITAALAAAVGVGRRVAVSLIAIGLVSAAAYTVGYRSMDLGDSSSGLFSDPVGYFVFLLNFLGGPSRYLSQSTWVATAAGLALLLFTVVALWRSRRAPAATPYGLALVAYLVLTVGAAGMVTLGRGDRGLYAASADRYQVLILVAWACALGVLAPRIQGGLANGRVMPAALLAAFALLLLLPQGGAMGDMRLIRGIRDDKDLTALAISLGVNDPRALSPAHPDPAFVLRMGTRLAADGKTVLADEPWVSLRQGLGTHVTRDAVSACAVSGASTDPWIDAGFARIAGYAELPVLPPEPAVMAVTDAAGQVAGYVLATQEEPEGPVALYGYVRLEAVNGPLGVNANATGCHLIVA